VSARVREAVRPGSRKTRKGDSGERKKPRCPICGKPTVETYRPFCSKHCADIDLGRWLDGRYAVSGESIGTDTDEEEKKN
jgi:endogenous inhibitor of DNA gyrase (YacG/DUF329 family)